tara:strand:+ start:36 stop:302 length:267 start_codon:yes stop_codon:yes gene_type:complete
VYNSLLLIFLSENPRTFAIFGSQLGKILPIFPQRNHTQNRCVSYKKATAQTAHLVFADAQANAEKTKRAVFFANARQKIDKLTSEVMR